MRREIRRKDVECLFVCLQGRFRILRNENFAWSDKLIIHISSACVVIHNLIVEYSRNGEKELDDDGNAVDCVTEFLEEGREESGEAESSEEGGEPGQGLTRLDELLGQSEVVMSVVRREELRLALTSHL